jgi:MFS family permease
VLLAVHGHTIRRLAGGLGLTAVALFHLAIGSVWTFVEEIDVSLKLNLNSSCVGGTLSAGNVLSLLSTALAVAFASRVGESRAMLLSLATLALGLAVMAADLTIPIYLAGAMRCFQ